MVENQAHRANESGSSAQSIGDWIGERLVRTLVIVGILGVFAPLFIQSLATLPTVGSVELNELPSTLVALTVGVSIPLLRDLASMLV